MYQVRYCHMVALRPIPSVCWSKKSGPTLAAVGRQAWASDSAQELDIYPVPFSARNPDDCWLQLLLVTTMCAWRGRWATNPKMSKTYSTEPGLRPPGKRLPLNFPGNFAPSPSMGQPSALPGLFGEWALALSLPSTSSSALHHSYLKVHISAC